MSDPTLALETALQTRLHALPAFNTRALPTAGLAAGYVIFQQAPSTLGGKWQTQDKREHTFRYLVKGVAATRAQALSLRAAADALLLASPLTADVWNCRAVSEVCYEEALDGGAFATHAGYVYEINLTEA